jgi:hypothetical protein
MIILLIHDEIEIRESFGIDQRARGVNPISDAS